MNKKRREALNDQIAPLEMVKSTLEDMRDQEQEYKDNLPEAFQNGEKGEAADTAISEIESAISNIEDAISNIENAKE